MAGRRPLPTAMKGLAGNPGHRPLNDSEPKPKIEAPEMPKGMPKAARREWNTIVPILLRLGVLSNIDGKALAAYCDAYAHWELARKAIEKYGLVVEEPVFDKDGFARVDVVKLKANPAVAEYATFGKLMKSYLIEFGLTPASRAKLKLEKPKEESDPVADLLARKPGAAEAIKQNAPLMFNIGAPQANPGKPGFGANIPDAAADFEA